MLSSALVPAHSRFVVRPEVVTYFLLAAFLLLVRRYQLDGKLYWLIGLPLLQFIWVNSHTLYALGPIVLWVFVAAEAAGRYLPWISESTDLMPWERLKWLAAAAAAVTLACLFNPYGLHGALFAVQLFAEIQSDDVLNGLITELHSPFRYAGVTFQFVSYITIIAVSAFGFILRRRAIAAGWLAVWGAFLYLSLMAKESRVIRNRCRGVDHRELSASCLADRIRMGCTYRLCSGNAGTDTRGRLKLLLSQYRSRHEVWFRHCSPTFSDPSDGVRRAGAAAPAGVNRPG